MKLYFLVPVRNAYHNNETLNSTRCGFSQYTVNIIIRGVWEILKIMCLSIQ